MRHLVNTRNEAAAPLQPPEEVFETACFSFIQCDEDMKDLMEALPVSLGTNRLFTVLIIQSLFQLCQDWDFEAVMSAPDECSPSTPKTK
jgi:hypothetical protein